MNEDQISKFLHLDQKYHGTEFAEQIASYLRDNDHARFHDVVKVSFLEMLVTSLNPLASCMADVNLAMNRFARDYAPLFEGARVLEIGSGMYLDQNVVDASEHYTGVDPVYQKLLMDPDLAGYLQFRRLLEKAHKGKGLLCETPKSTSQTRMDEWFLQEGKVTLIPGLFEDISMDVTYDVVVNNGLVVTEDAMAEISRLLTPEGHYVDVSYPVMWTLNDRAQPHEHFESVKEYWLELVAPFKSQNTLLVVGVYSGVLDD
ncbi:hypothetical protein HN419_06360 [Candidatus Woesearchaeota archaeon]|jgi:hypothetical protein|nr:hypothetical protein [Candidatus Woesearchaeota archaeon]MBT3538117.1 hypothetical protein [Candidatus Woesearchaeota archaeon]MBT4697524.1 hypothetical protein [Candidatus Woesearchaeota archaeon]MBT4717371.1 hypothetical protein [Candidatus Woesearchaeota archaeon]MBT7105786.1 hypothetical protein [Candidatus Woesearchaeota archaeon]